MPYPDSDDLQGLLDTAGLWLQEANLDLTGALERAIEKFELDTGFRPFLVGSSDQTRRFHAPGAPGRNPAPYRHLGTGSGATGGGKTLSLGGGLTALTSLTVDDAELQQDRDFFLWPANAPVEAEPYTLIEFPGRIWAQPNGIVIIGRWGYATTLPALARDAILAGAAIVLAPLIATRRRVTSENGLAPSGGTAPQVRSKTTGPVSVEYAVLDPGKTSDLSSQVNAWNDVYQSGVNRYRLAI